MKRGVCAVITVTLLALSGAHAGEIESLNEASLDVAKSRIFVVVRKDPGTPAASKAHDHVILAADWTGTLALPSSGVTGCRGTISVPVAGLVVDEPAMRKRAALEGELQEADRAKVRENMLASGQLNADLHPKIEVNVVNCKAGVGNLVTLELRLSIRGATVTRDVPAQVTWNGNRFVAKGTFLLAHSDFGLKPYSAFLGAVANLDELTFFFEIAGKRSGTDR